ncbi:MAG: sigma 54-interacting transcriptional regulator [Negativicutes bacterium]|nr:sigma 54-interacting transcriptional regulator [Negativicutes bacterium]
MSRIVFIAPDKQQYIQGKNIIHELGLDDKIDLYLARLKKAVVLAKSLENEDIDVIISRGGTAQLIVDSEIRIPVVEIPVTGLDLAQVFHEAKKLTGLARPKVLMSVFPGLLHDIKVLADILDIELTVRPENIPHSLVTIAQLKATDVDIVVGGKRTVMLAAQKGFKTLLIRSGDFSFRSAFQEAQKIALGRKIEKEHAQEFKALVDYSSEAIISIDRHKIIKVFNPTAERLLNRTAREMLGQKIERCLDLVNIEACLSEGREFLGQTIEFGSIWISFNVAPIKVDDMIIGAIITFQDITRIQEMEARIRNDVLAKKFVAKYNFPDILGISPQIVEAKRIAQEMAAVDATVLIAGESGTGKELFAQSIHNISPRRNGPFVALNCAALPPNLLESELFGYVEGAFTGATKKGKPGLFEMAHRGTIFLDEISEMDKYGQSRLLRVLQEKQVMRLGDDKNIPIDARIIAATNKNLIELVEEGHFRQDLFYRLNVLTLSLPPLRERKGDIKYLAQHFLENYNRQYHKRIEMELLAYDYLRQHPWSGNIREIMHFIERLVVITSEQVITDEVIRKYWGYKDAGPKQAGNFSGAASPPVLSEEGQIKAALAQCGQHITRTAELLGMNRSTLYRKLRIYNIEIKKSY